MEATYPSTPFDVAAVLITLAAVLSWLNTKVLKLPSSLGLALMGAVASVVTLLLDWIFPQIRLAQSARALLESVDFRKTLMDGMLSFLLFAGALHVDLGHLRRKALPVAVLSTVGVIGSTLLVGYGLNFITSLAGFGLPIEWCLLFGALISPTDPVAVMAAMKNGRTPEALQAMVSGESLFNDGVGIVVFSVILVTVTGSQISPAYAAESFLFQAVGGAVMGLAIGWIGFRAMRVIDDYGVELLITLAIVMGGYALAQQLHISGPVAMAVAGLLIGNQGVALAMSDTTRDHVLKFWALVDTILTAVLFLLIGLEGVVLIGETRLLLIGVAAIPLVLAARALSVAPTLAIWRRSLPMRSALPILVWGGLRGGISIAMALSLPSGDTKDILVTVTYVVVLFSVLVQGSTLGRVVPRAETTVRED